MLCCSIGYSMLPETLVVKKEAAAAAAEKDAAQSGGSLGERARSTYQSWQSEYGELLQSHNQQGLIAMALGRSIMISSWMVVMPLHATEIWGATPGGIGKMFAMMAAVRSHTALKSAC